MELTFSKECKHDDQSGDHPHFSNTMQNFYTETEAVRYRMCPMQNVGYRHTSALNSMLRLDGGSNKRRLSERELQELTKIDNLVRRHLACLCLRLQSGAFLYLGLTNMGLARDVLNVALFLVHSFIQMCLDLDFLYKICKIILYHIIIYQLLRYLWMNKIMKIHIDSPRNQIDYF